MKNLFLLCFLTLLLSSKLLAQDNRYKNYKYEWSAEKPKEIKVEEQFKNEDAVILEERNLNVISTSVHSKYFRIKFLTDEGIRKFGTIALPQSSDFQADLNAIAYWEKDTVHRPLGEHNSLIYFVTRIIKPDGTITPATFQERIQKHIYRYNQIDEKYYSWLFTINQLKPGDELEIALSYTGIFNDNNFFNRIFFNGELPKQNYELKIRYPNTSLYLFQNHNGASAPDTGVYKGTNPNSVEYTWRATNLKGCIAEIKSRAYLELPYVSFYAHQNDYGTLSSNRAYVEKSLPYPWEFIFLGNNDAFRTPEPGYVDYLPENIKLMLNKIEAENIAVRNFIEEYGGQDTNKTLRFSKIHDLIADSFSYAKDFEPHVEYMGEDFSKVNVSINKKNLREIDRIDLYDRINFRLQTEYWHCRLYDKRHARMNYNVFYPSRVYNIYYVLPYKKSYLFYFPKMSRTGYYTNEIPFYYEDVQTMLIPRTVPNEEKNDPNKNISFIKISTPYSNISDNSRITTAMCNISLQNKTAQFETRLNLSGQFSTLTRGFYLYGEMDSTLEACYYQPVYAVSSNSKLISKEMTSRKTTFPYECNFKLKYDDDKIISSTNAGTYKVSLKNWFNNLSDKNLETKNRVMAYYPDFLYTDQHRYMLKFDKPVEITNMAEFNVAMENTYGKYSISIKQMDDTSFLLETILTVNTEKIEPHNIFDVRKIFDKIDWLNNSELQLKEK